MKTKINEALNALRKAKAQPMIQAAVTMYINQADDALNEVVNELEGQEPEEIEYMMVPKKTYENVL